MSEPTDLMETIEPELEAHLRRTLQAVAATVNEARADVNDAVIFDSAKGARPGRWGWLGAVAAVILAVVVGAATLRDATVHPAAELAAGTWSAMDSGPLSPRFAPSVVWTGTEMVVIGGFDQSGAVLSDGAAYNPSTDTWRPISSKPSGRVSYPGPWHQQATPAVVVGDQILTLAEPVDNNESGWGWDLVAYDLATDTWAILDENRFDQLPTDELVSTAGSATVRSVHSMVAWRDQLIVFGQDRDVGIHGWASFNPNTRTWGEFTPVDNVENLDAYPASVGSPTLIDDRYLVLLFELGAARPNLGVVIDLELDTSQLIPSPTAPEGEVADDRTIYNFGIWSNGTAGTVMAGEAISNEGQAWRVAAILDPGTAELSLATPPSKGPLGEGPGAMVAIPGGYLTVGGLTIPGRSGGLEVESVVLVTDKQLTRWVDAPKPPIDINRTEHAAIWTGKQVLIWGGATVSPDGPINRADQPLGDGALFTPGSG